MKVTEKQAHILHHSLGLTDGRRDSYRNHFCTGIGSDDYADCMDLVSAGLMYVMNGSPITGGDFLFTVSDEGRKVAIALLPHEPVLTRSQKRYRQFLKADSHWSFGEWLKHR